ncbi:unnamed protein product [Meganyctiphanes norvegica]|uniref:Peptidase S1 domain-containing protein n=1 Tax=Meganyctiphanes norvegica TaxID=48144 RepID=A0AAV2PJ53_MEGNR
MLTNINILICTVILFVCTSGICCDGSTQPDSSNGIPNLGNDEPRHRRLAPNPVSSNQCGIRSIDGLGFTLSEAEDGHAYFGEFPWMVALLKLNNEYVGGGSLVHPGVVLTAADIVYELSNTSLVARLGTLDLSVPSQLIPPQNINVKRILVHPDFTRYHWLTMWHFSSSRRKQF